MWIFDAVKASLIVIYIMAIKNIFFYISEAVMGRCSDIYRLEIYAKEATRDINHFFIEVGRGLHPRLLTSIKYWGSSCLFQFPYGLF